MVNKFRGGAVEEPIDVHPGCVGSEKGDTKTSKVGVPMSIDENVGLGECEDAMKGSEKEPHALNILMDYIHAV